MSSYTKNAGSAIPKADNMSEIMGALLFAMKDECDCLSCKALQKMADSIISKSAAGPKLRPRKKVRS